MTLAGKLFQSIITWFEKELSLTFVRALGLQSLKLCDMILVYQLLHGMLDADASTLFTFATYTSTS